jgi:hypothetical protein
MTERRRLFGPSLPEAPAPLEPPCDLLVEGCGETGVRSIFMIRFAFECKARRRASPRLSFITHQPPPHRLPPRSLLLRPLA